ncbi:MAG: sulfotransferase family 2 domain-containing protein [Rhodobacteraceae bacterium]|nr:sulfotransferase family 2 domain-containing protein [Paracoccaceae bacterium]
MARNAPFVERNMRRMRILSGRLWHSLPGAAPRHRSVFLHMPKCGGTSLSEAMYATVPLRQRLGVIDAVSTRRAAAMIHHGCNDPALSHEDSAAGDEVFDLRHALLLQHMAWDTWLIHGHVFYSDMAMREYGDLYKLVTVLRDPAERTISNYRMARRRGATRDDLDSYLQGPLARLHGTVFLRYLAGRNTFQPDEIPAAVARAKSRLERFAVIGFLDDLPDFARRYRQAFGVKLSVGRLNAAPAERLECTDAQRALLGRLCAADREIFDHARALVAAGKSAGKG